MSLNQIKRFLRGKLPDPVFRAVQNVRKLGHRPSDEQIKRKAEFDQLQKRLGGVGRIAIRENIVLNIDEESRESFEWFCWRSDPMVEELDGFISRVRGAKSFVDVGATHGIFSLVFLALNPTARVLAVDPSPLSGKILLRNKELNHAETLDLKQVACDKAAGTIPMYYNWHHLEASGSGRHPGSMDVAALPLDQICANESLDPEIIKIDVEGFEFQVLCGAERVVSKARLMFLEVSPERYGELNVSLGEIYDWLQAHELEVRTMTGATITASQFADQIHTFWTVCEKRTQA